MPYTNCTRLSPILHPPLSQLSVSSLRVINYPHKLLLQPPELLYSMCLTTRSRDWEAHHSQPCGILALRVFVTCMPEQSRHIIVYSIHIEHTQVKHTTRTFGVLLSYAHMCVYTSHMCADSQPKAHTRTVLLSGKLSQLNEKPLTLIFATNT